MKRSSSPGLALGPTPTFGFTIQHPTVALAQDTSGTKDWQAEVDRLRAENDALRKDVLASQEAADRMLEDLMATQSKLEETAQETAKKDSHIAAVHRNVQELEKTQSTATNVGSADLATTGHPSQDVDAAALQDQISRLVEALGHRDHELNNARAELHHTRQAAQTSQHHMEQSQAMMAEIQTSNANVQQLHHQNHALKKEAEELRSRLSQRESDSTCMHSALAANDAGTKELQKLVEFFRQNSERTSRQARDLKVENQRLKESLQKRDAELQEQSSLVHGLRLQLQDFGRYRR